MVVLPLLLKVYTAEGFQPEFLSHEAVLSCGGN
jgi:hypothetical protein